MELLASLHLMVLVSKRDKRDNEKKLIWPIVHAFVDTRIQERKTWITFVMAIFRRI
ncbi:MAG: hypothetical protein JWQ10_3100, partial [Herbaspirillum sp.]|nr:hypothetical protein [Herbaspirillum sp.]